MRQLYIKYLRLKNKTGLGSTTEEAVCGTVVRGADKGLRPIRLVACVAKAIAIIFLLVNTFRMLLPKGIQQIHWRAWAPDS